MCVATVALWCISFHEGVRIIPRSSTEEYDGFILSVGDGLIVTGDHVDREKFHSTHAIPIWACTLLFALGPCIWLLARTRDRCFVRKPGYCKCGYDLRASKE